MLRSSLLGACALSLVATLAACDSIPEEMPSVELPSVAEIKQKVTGEEPDGPKAPPRRMQQTCEDKDHADDPVTGGCYTETIGCDASVEGHTQGGVNNWDAEFYRGKYCTPLPGDYSGTERVYRFEMPANTLAEIELISPCDDLDLFVMVWSDETRCPGEPHLISECESDVKRGGGEVNLFTDHHPKTYLIGVDGKLAATAPFRVVTRCRGM